MIPHPAPLAAALALALMAAPLVAAAPAEDKPVAAGSVVIREDPGNALVAEATTDRDGRFSVRINAKPRFNYQISLPCRTRTACTPGQLTLLTVNGRPVRPVESPPQQRLDDRNGIGIYIVGAVVLGLREPAPVVVTGRVIEAPVAGPLGPVGAAPRTLPGASAIPRN